MTAKRVRDVLSGQLARSNDDRGSIPMLMLVILVGASLGSILLAMVLQQTHTTTFDATRVRSLDAAQAGIDVMLGEIRDATQTDTSGKIFGDSGQLPCNSVSGSANGTGTATYSVSVSYYTSDPGKGATAMTCATGYGPYSTDPVSGPRHTPKFAVITATGQDATGANGASKGRTLSTTYVFQTDDVNIPGGQIQIFPNGSGATYCMDAGSSTPAVGAAVLLRPCSSSLPPAAQQMFAYRSDLSIQLLSSVTAANPTGLCLDTSPTAHANGDAIVLNTCNALGTATWNQQWSIDDNSRLQGANTSQTDLDNSCITAPTQTSGTALVLQSCFGGTSDTTQTWVPSTTTGAGMSGASNNQIVNFQNFANCIDVTEQNPNYGYLILYTCKQNPNPAKVTWNQKFSPALGPNTSTALPKVGIITFNNGTLYCLQSPPTSNAYVLVQTACTTIWTWNQTKDSNGNALPYSQLYTITDGSGRCLAPGLTGPSDRKYLGQYLKIIVTACDGSTTQKWNADPSVLASRLTNTGEK